MTRYDPHPQAHDDARTTPHGFTTGPSAAQNGSGVPEEGGGLREALEALADEWERDWEASVATGVSGLGEASRKGTANRLRAVLAAHPADAPEAPEPSGDVVERARDLIDHHRRLRTSHGLAQDLAAAGLLADPAETERRENVAKAWAERWLAERDRARDAAVALEQEVARLDSGRDYWRQRYFEEVGRLAQERDEANHEVEAAEARVADLERQNGLLLKQAEEHWSHRQQSEARVADLEADNARLTEQVEHLLAVDESRGRELDAERARVADMEAEVERWTEKAQEAGKAYADANAKHHEELDRANRLERLANTLAERAVDLEDGKRAAEARARRAEDALRRMTATARCVLGDNRIESDADLGNYPDPNLAELWLDVKHADRALAGQTSDATTKED